MHLPRSTNRNRKGLTSHVPCRVPPGRTKSNISVGSASERKEKCPSNVKPHEIRAIRHVSPPPRFAQMSLLQPSGTAVRKHRGRRRWHQRVGPRISSHVSQERHGDWCMRDNRSQCSLKHANDVVEETARRRRIVDQEQALVIMQVQSWVERTSNES